MTKPSEILLSLSHSLPPDTFAKLLTEYLYPVLDSLPVAQRDSVCLILKQAKDKGDHAQAVMKHVEYDRHKKSLEDGIAALVKHVKRNWETGAHTQSEMMLNIAKEVVKWLPALWRAGVENGLEISLIQTCLSLCMDTLRAAGSTGSRVEFEFDIEIDIKDSKDRAVYSQKCGDIERALTWLWRDLALSAFVHHVDQKVIDDIISAIEKFRLVDEVDSFLRGEGEERTEEGYRFHDEHWNESMKGAVSNLRHALYKTRLSAFEIKPSISRYDILVTKSPSLESSLLDIIRHRIFSDWPTVSDQVAAEIFRRAKQTDDMLKLLNTMERSASRSAVQNAKKIIVKYLANQSSTDLRANGLKVVESELKDVKHSIWNEIQNIFPNFDEAWDLLEDMVRRGKLVKRVPKNMPRDDEYKRDDLLTKFIKLATKGEYGCALGSRGFGIDDEDMEGVDKGDSDYEERKEMRRPDFAKRIQDWVKILLRWPDKAEAGKVWNELHESKDMLFDVDGLAESLASRCDWQWSHVSAKQYLADGIRAMYTTFACPDLDALEKIQ